ncbi:MAG: hypothetical protein GXO56_01015 [Chloroflexi bacterium]|nr:hypothetical protein [Chloroflexota bacterium]
MFSKIKFGLLVVISFSLFGCINMLKVKEVFEGSDAWVRELTRGMTITAQYPEGEVHLHEPYDLFIRIENHGEHEPHLNTAIVELLNEQENEQKEWACIMVEPEPSEVKPFSSGYLFYMPPEKVKMNAVTVIRLQCTFNQPGTYKLLLAAEFQESGTAFVSRVFSVTAR